MIGQCFELASDDKKAILNQLNRTTKLLKVCQASNKVLLGLHLTTNGENNKSAFFLLNNHYTNVKVI
jgi:hypothetical protein